MRGQIRKRRKSWAVIVYLGRDAHTGKERRKWYTHHTKSEAERHLAHLLVQVQGSGSLPPSRLRVGDYLEQWLRDYAEGTVAPTTLASYQSTIRRHLLPALGSIPLTRLTAQAIQGYLGQKLRDSLSSTSVRYHHGILRHALASAVRWDLLIQNPADRADPPRTAHHEVRLWDTEQVLLFLGEAKRHSRYYPLYLAAIHTGMRQGELLGLRWQDVDMMTGTITVRQKFYRLGGRQLFGPPKNHTARPVTMTADLLDVLGAVRREQAEARCLQGTSYEDHDLVFCQPNGRPHHAHNIVRRDFRRLMERAALPRLTFHALRHLCASYMFRAGIHPKIVQERLGHASPAYTMKVYGHLVSGMQEDAVRRMEGWLGESNSEGPGSRR